METQRLNDHSVVTQLSSQKCLLLGHMPTLQFFIFLLLFVCFLVYFLLKGKLESRFPGEISIALDMKMIPPLWH